MSKTTIVFYHVINDKEDKNSQNVYYISKPINLITLRDVKNEFPLMGTYHFRFKVVHSNTDAWVDINDESSSVPSFNSCIYAKVLRLSWLDKKSEKEKEKEREKYREREKEKGEKEIEREREREEENSLERIICDSEKLKFHKREKSLYDNKIINDGIDHSRSKNNIDMLLFETAPHNKHSNVSKNKKSDGEKDQNYFDLMFN